MTPQIPRIGVSIISLYPWSIGLGGPERALRIAKRAGLDGLQLLPLRGLRKSDLKKLPPNSVISYEGDWRGFEPGTTTPIKGTLRDTALFGSHEDVAEKISWFKELFPKALPIDTKESDCLLEISPANSTKLSDYFNHPIGLVVDTKHLWQEPLIYSPPVYFLKQLEQQNKIRLVHFQPATRKDYTNFLSPLSHSSKVGYRYSCICKSSSTVVIEFKPYWFLNTLKILKSTKNRILEIWEREREYK